MTTRSRELILEILLLAEKFSARDFEAAKRELSSFSQFRPMIEILQSLYTTKRKADGTQPAPPSKEKNVRDVARAFVSQLENAKSERDYKRIENIAKRLNLPNTGIDRMGLTKKIKSEFEKMSDGELSKLLRSYKAPAGPDDDYVGLAQYLIGSRDQKQ